MSTHKYMDRICLLAVLCAFVLMALFLGSDLKAAEIVMGYEDRLFDPETVHTIDITMADWDSFIETCENEEYAACTVVIDGEDCGNVGIRAKGNTSLSTVSSMDSDRYSFKLEFDQYDNTKSYYGLDKLSLNNLIQDTTMMKDYLTYQLMGQFGAAAPLCSYVYITVNGEDWGLYLAVEGVEDAFLERNYGADHGELYKPDSMNFGGGRGNGRDFNMDDFMERRKESADTGTEATPAMPENFDPTGMPNGFAPDGMGEMPDNFDPNTMGGGQMPGGFSFEEGARPEMPDGTGGFGMGSGDVKLQYIDDDPDSYSTIFESAKTDLTDADKARLIEALKTLSGDDPTAALDVDTVLRYFVVHNFVVNGDSYTGSMIHNYYLYEEDGRLSMLPWDYNLAFGTFQGGGASSSVNDPIDTPQSVTGSGDRPMIDWIFSDEVYLSRYHALFAAFLEQTDFSALIQKTAALIAPYVERDPSKFYSYEEFETGVRTLETFCLLREQSVLAQLSGLLPSTREGQQADSTGLIDTGDLNLSDMGSMGMGGGFGRPSQPAEMPNGAENPMAQTEAPQRPQGDRNFPNDFAQPTQTGMDSGILLGVTLLILAAGLLFAWRYRRWK